MTEKPTGRRGRPANHAWKPLMDRRDFANDHQLADAAGVTVPALRSYRGGHKAPSVQILMRLAAALGVSLEQMADLCPKCRP